MKRDTNFTGKFSIGELVKVQSEVAVGEGRVVDIDKRKTYAYHIEFTRLVFGDWDKIWVRESELQKRDDLEVA